MHEVAVAFAQKVSGDAERHLAELTLKFIGKDRGKRALTVIELVDLRIITLTRVEVLRHPAQAEFYLLIFVFKEKGAGFNTVNVEVIAFVLDEGQGIDLHVSVFVGGEIQKRRGAD